MIRCPYCQDTGRFAAALEDRAARRLITTEAICHCRRGDAVVQALLAGASLPAITATLNRGLSHDVSR